MMDRWYKRYILKDRQVVEVSIAEWERWVSENEIAMQIAHDKFGNVDVSTVFIGINFCEGAPMVFETMVLSGKLEGHVIRYDSYEQALEGHKAIVAIVRAVEEQGGTNGQVG